MATSISVDDESIQQLVQTIKTNIEKILQNGYLDYQYT